MVISYGALAGLIAAIAFLVLVLFTIPVLRHTTKAIEEANKTMQTTNESIKKISEDVNGLMGQTSDLLDKTNLLLADVTGKMKTIEPVVKAAADLGESVSEINTSSKKMVKRFNNRSRFSGAGIVSSVLAATLARRKRRKGED